MGAARLAGRFVPAIDEALVRLEREAPASALWLGAERLIEVLLHGGALDPLLERAGIPRTALAALLAAEPASGGAGPSVSRILDEAERERMARGSRLLGPEHVLLALAQWPRGSVARALRRGGLTHGRIAAALGEEALQDGVADDPDGPGGAGEHSRGAPAIRGTIEVPAGAAWLAPPPPFTVDLTRQAAEGRLDAAPGREALVEQLAVSLSRRGKASVLLVGEPGVGKTALVEELARRMAGYGSSPAPQSLRRARLLALDVGALLGGTRLRGDLEERVVELLAALEARGESILFVDEVHQLFAPGEASSVGALLKPALGRGTLRCIGATTFDDARRYLGRDPALARRFHTLVVEEPDEPAAVAMVASRAGPIGAHHGVALDDEAVTTAVRLTRRYLPERRLPDKAIDVLDEAAARARLAGSQAVDAGEVARVVSRWTGVPLGALAEDERSRLARLEAALRQEIVGQDRAVRALTSSLRRARAGLRVAPGPAGSFLCVGPPGVGKTALARAMARHLAGDERSLVRIDLSLFSEAHQAARLVGAPPGYLGHEEGGQLTEALRRRPLCVLLLDEADKAHPAVLAALLPLLDEGRLVDGRGRLADGREALVVLTANPPGVAAPGPGGDAGSLDRALRQCFRPELLDRLDAVLHFAPLDATALCEVARMRLEEVRDVLAERGVSLRWDPAALALLATLGSDGGSARPMRRTVEREVLDPLADRLIAGDLEPGCAVELTASGGQLVMLAARQMN